MRKPAHCRSCRARIWWVEMHDSGVLAPVDADPVEHGNIIIGVQRGTRKLIGRVLKAGDRVEPGRNRYVSHFATCTDASKHRKASS